MSRSGQSSLRAGSGAALPGLPAPPWSPDPAGSGGPRASAVPVARLSRVHTLSSHLPVVFGAVLVYTFINVFFFLKSLIHLNPQLPEHQESK